MEFDETIDEDTPMGLLRGIKFGTETYHVLFMRLCRWDFPWNHMNANKQRGIRSKFNPNMSLFILCLLFLHPLEVNHPLSTSMSSFPTLKHQKCGSSEQSCINGHGCLNVKVLLWSLIQHYKYVSVSYMACVCMFAATVACTVLRSRATLRVWGMNQGWGSNQTPSRTPGTPCP